MKRILFVALLTAFMGFGQFAEDLFREGNIAYNLGDYSRAISYYDSIVSKGVHSPELYFNLANAHYKRNAIAPSILNYEKALLLDPDNVQIHNNLAFAQNMTLDRFSPLPESDIKKATNSLLFLTSVHGWSVVVIICTWLSVLLFFLYLKTAYSGSKRFYFSGFILLVLCAVLALLFAIQQNNTLKNTRPAIIFAREESFRSEPNLRSEELLSLHEGTKVFVQENVEDWVKVRLTNGAVGWMPKSSIHQISFAEE